MKELRKERGLTIKALADAAGVSERHIAFIESGDRLPSLDVALKISSTLGCSVEKIFSVNSTDCTSKAE